VQAIKAKIRNKIEPNAYQQSTSSSLSMSENKTHGKWLETKEQMLSCQWSNNATD